MTPLLITEAERTQIRDVREFAEQFPIDMTALVERIKTPEGKKQHMAQMTRQTITIPMAFLVTFSIETGHPCGTCRHMSMSVQKQGRAPNEIALWMVAQEFGFWGGLDKCSIWPERLTGHGIALNVVQPISPGAAVKT